MIENRNDDKKEKNASPLPEQVKEKVKNKFGEFKSEFKKIIWPDKKSLTRHTITVIMTSLIVGAVIVALDFVFGNAYSLFVQLLS